MLINSFLNYLKVENKSDNTIKNYAIDLIKFQEYFQKTKNIQEFNKTNIGKITILDLDEYLFHLKQKNNGDLSEATRARKTNTIKSFFKYLHRKEIISKDIGKNITAPKLGKNIPVHLVLADANKLMNSVEDIRNKTMIAFLLMTGLRISELISLNIEDIQSDFSFTIRGKGNKQRHIKLNKECVKQLKEYLTVRKKDKNGNALFTSSRQNRISIINTQKMIKKEVESILGYTNISAHKLRHSFCTLMYESGVDTMSLKEIMGHSDIKTTEIYTHLSVAHIDKSFEKNPLTIN